MKLDLAQRLAERFAAELQPYCSRLEIAGSIRRRRPEVGDIDLVCIPRGVEGRAAILSRCATGPDARRVKEGEQYVVFEYVSPAGWAAQLDLWFAHEDQTDLFDFTPSNWGMLLLSRTGSAMHNVCLAQQAKGLGLHFHPHQGILEGRQVVASRTEAEIFHLLGLNFIRPEDRER
jgi:DNA polymerase/3'-5' exonuclease PolX